MFNPIQTSTTNTTTTLGLFDVASVDQARTIDFNDTQHQGVLGQKIVISIQRGKNMQTKIEGIPSHFSLKKLLKKLKANDKEQVANLLCYMADSPRKSRHSLRAREWSTQNASCVAESK